MNREEQIKMWEMAANKYGKLGAKEVAAANKYGELGAEEVRKIQTNAKEQGRPLTPSERAAAALHAQNASKAASKQGSDERVRGSAAVHGDPRAVAGATEVHGSSPEAAATRKNLFGK